MTKIYQESGITVIVFNEELEEKFKVERKDRVKPTGWVEIPKTDFNLHEAGGFNYLDFGTLQKAELTNTHIHIYNELDQVRSKSRKYQSWPTTWSKIQDMMGNRIITRTTADYKPYANEWFSDLFHNEIFTVRVPDGDGNFAPHSHRLLEVPRIKDKERPDIQKSVREAIITARIAIQSREYWAERRLRMQYADLEEMNEQNENLLSLLTKDELDSVEADAKELAIVAPEWIASGEEVPLRIVNDRQRNGLTHVDKEFAMFCGIDVTNKSRIHVKPQVYHGGSNFIICEYLPDKEESPVNVQLGLLWYKKEQCWQIKTVTAGEKGKQIRKLAKKHGHKDEKKPVEYFLDIYDKVIQEMIRDGSL